MTCVDCNGLFGRRMSRDGSYCARCYSIRNVTLQADDHYGFANKIYRASLKHSGEKEVDLKRTEFDWYIALDEIKRLRKEVAELKGRPLNVSD